MTNNDIIRMAREAGFTVCRDEWVLGEMLERFAKLVRDDYSNKHANLWLDRCHAFMRAEREACAKVCDEESSNLGGVAEGPFVTDFGKHTHMSMAAGAQNCAAAIRARGETK
jgi:hypothetical protein